MPETLFNIRMDEEDRALLDACSAKEKLTRSDIIRRAVRAYAAKLGVTPETTRPQARKKK